MRGSLRIDLGADKVISVTFSPESSSRIWGGAVAMVHPDNEEDLRKILQRVGVGHTAIANSITALNERRYYEIRDLAVSEEVLQTARLID